MSKLSKPNLILHPLRLRILSALAVRPLTPQELAEGLAAPLPSLYRHLKLLLNAGFLEIVEMRQVRGALEKTYRLKSPARLSAEDMAELDKQGLKHFFEVYTVSLIQEFTVYLEKAPQKPDLLADRVGCTEIAFYATDGELDLLGKQLNEALQPLAANPPGEGRRLRKLAVISHPLWEKENGDGT